MAVVATLSLSAIATMLNSQDPVLLSVVLLMSIVAELFL
jgi:hypothetical protein